MRCAWVPAGCSGGWPTRLSGTLPLFLLVGLVAGAGAGVLGARAELRRYQEPDVPMYHGCGLVSMHRSKADCSATDGTFLMLTDFPVLYVDVIVRRTIVVVHGLGRRRFGRGRVAVASPWPASGVVLGLAGATVNHRFFQVSTARYSKAEGHLQTAGRTRAALPPASGRSPSLPSRCFFSSARWASGWSAALSPSSCC